MNKLAVYFLMCSSSPSVEKTVLELLMIPEISVELKRYMIYNLILDGRRESFGAVGGNVYERIRPGKLVFEKNPDGVVYVSGYAHAVSRLAFIGLKNPERLAFFANAVYKKFGGLVKGNVLLPEEIAALITLNCDYKSISEVNFLSRIFCVKKERLIELKAIYDGKGEVKDGKNN